MAAKGTDEKLQITKKILEVFPGSFEYGKEIRVPIGDVQIKIALTCAKDNIEITSSPVPASIYSDDGFPAPVGSAPIETKEEVIANKPTQEEIDNVKKIMAALDL